MSETRIESHGAFERVRKAASRTALTAFASSFLVLLVASATPYWTPENEWLVVTDQVCKVSGVTALALGLIPSVRRLLTTLGEWLGLSG